MLSIPAASRVDFCTRGTNGTCVSKWRTDPQDVEKAQEAEDSSDRQFSAVALGKWDQRLAAPIKSWGGGGANHSLSEDSDLFPWLDKAEAHASW